MAALLLCLARNDASVHTNRRSRVYPADPFGKPFSGGQEDLYYSQWTAITPGRWICPAQLQKLPRFQSYQHILPTLNIHSSQAILVYYMMESSSDVWHKYHVELKHSYLESYPQLLSNMVSGSYHPLNHQLTYFALHFTATDPVSRNTE